MNARNWLTLLGGIAVAVGPAMQSNAPTPMLFWIGQVITVAGGTILASKAFTDTAPPKA